MAGRKPDVTDEEILAVLRATADPVLATSEVSDELQIGRTATYKRLRELETTGEVKSKEIGNALAWWLATPDSE